MKKHYTKFIISTIMVLMGGRAVAQSARHPEISKADAIKYVKELNMCRSAKLDTIYKYRANNLYNLLTEHLKEQNRLCEIAINTDNKDILKLQKAYRRAKTDFARESIQQQMELKGAEQSLIYEYYNNIKDMYIDDAFIKCLNTRNH